MARILVIDDAVGFCEVVQEYLVEVGHEVEVAIHREMGLEKVREFHPHVVLLDLNMPGIGGLSAIQKVKSIDSLVRIMVVTGETGEEKVRLARKCGAEDYVTKPVALTELHSRINLQLLKMSEGR